MNDSTLSVVAKDHPVYRDARTYYQRGLVSVDAAHADRECFRLILADDRADEVERLNAEMRLAAVEAMLAEVDRIARSQPGIPSSPDQVYTAWKDLAALVREQTDLPELIQELGLIIYSADRSGAQWHGPCPICGGIDRWQVFNRTGWRSWCRQCDWSADAVALVQSFVSGCEHFRDAVRWLADRLQVRA
jgi:hypothetical protein